MSGMRILVQGSLCGSCGPCVCSVPKGAQGEEAGEGTVPALNGSCRSPVRIEAPACLLAAVLDRFLDRSKWPYGVPGSNGSGLPAADSAVLELYETEALYDGS